MNIYGITLDELEKYFLDRNDKKFKATQIYDWVYKKRVSSFDEMRNVSKETIKLLNIPDRDYVFEYAVYYKNSDGLYYDVDARANSISRGTKKYNAVLVSKETVLNMDSATVSLYEIERQKYAFVDFFFDVHP